MKKVLGIGFLAAFCFTACAGSDVKPYDPNKERKFFSVAVRKLPPEPVYNRLKTVYLPEPLPNQEIRRASYSKLAPVYQFEMVDATLEETARVMASLARYTSYCSSVIADRKINLTAVGNIDEIGKYVAEQTGVNVVIDHANHEIRFLAGGGRYIRESTGADGRPGDFKISEKTDGVLNNIKIDG